MLSFSTGSATDANVSGIAKIRVSADQPAPIPPIHTATSRHNNPHLLLRRIAGSHVPLCGNKVVAIEQFIIGELDARNAPYVLTCIRPERVIRDQILHEI